MISESIRRYGYWCKDFLTGGNVRKQYKDSKYILLNSDKSKDKQSQYLNELLEHATNSVEFYKKFKGNDISKFPVINKNTIKSNPDSFLSNKYDKEKLFKLHTSGSTGTPFTIYQDQRKRERILAEQILFGELAGYKIGMKYIFFRVWTDLNKKSKFTCFAQNLIMTDILNLDEETLEEIRQTLKKDKQIKYLIGYSSTFENIASYLVDKGDTPDMFGVELVVYSSEILSDLARSNLEKVFGCNIISRYSNQENGILAQDCSKYREHHINTASFHIELLKLDEDIPAEIGELGRVVVTDLFNYAMPFIRYDTGDLAILKNKANCKLNTPVFDKIEGRRVDLIYNTKGEKMSPHTVTNLMWKYTKLKQFQFIQNSLTEYELKLNGAKGVYDDNEFKKMFKDAFGDEANIKIEHVKEIGVLNSGKRKMIVCNYTK